MGELYLLEDLFNTLIGLEEYGVKTYNELAEKSDDLEVNRLFLRLAEQEQAHKDHYTDLKTRFDDSSDVDEEYASYLNILIKNSFFKNSSANDINDIDSALSLAITLEKETLLFLTETQNVLGKEASRAFEIIKNEERRHLGMLLKMVEKRRRDK